MKSDLERIDLELDSFTDIDVLIDMSMNQDNLIDGINYALNLSDVESEILDIDKQISNLESQIQPEERCPTCGQLMEEGLEET